MVNKNRNRLTPALRRQLEVAAAVASEDVVQMHASRALELVELAHERVTAPRMLLIYSRVHNLDASSAQTVATRVLATLGQRAVESGALVQAWREDEEEEVFGDSRSLLRVIRERLRGRIHHDLRRWIELHTGEVQVALLELHTTHALRFLQLLDSEFPTSATVDTYARMLGVRETHRTALYYSVLARLAAAELPRSRQQAPPQVPLFAGDAGVAARRVV